MGTNTPFRALSQTLTIAASTTSADEQFGAPVGTALRVVNNTAAVAFVRSGVGAQTATAADVPVAANADRVIGVGHSHDTVAVLLSAGTGNVYVTKGEGV